MVDYGAPIRKINDDAPSPAAFLRCANRLIPGRRLWYNTVEDWTGSNRIPFWEVMMKRRNFLLLVCLLLVGCAAGPETETALPPDSVAMAEIDTVVSEELMDTPLLSEEGRPASTAPDDPETDKEPVVWQTGVVALLDTGVSAAALPAERLLPGWNYVTGSNDTQDRINHGTAVASVLLGCESAGVVGIAPQSRILPLVVVDKVEGETVSAAPEVLAQAVRDSVDQYGARIINVSLGIRKDDPALRDAVAYVQERGALVISAVGNDGESADLYYPAAYDGVLAVGSHDRVDAVSDFTQRNGTADILAPGEDIWLASRNGKTYGSRGTSYATGFVSAAAAQLWMQRPEESAQAIAAKILSSARTVEGWKILDLEAVFSLSATG